MFLAHHLVQIYPRRINTLTPHILTAVEHVIKNLDAKMGHSNFVDVRKTHSEPDIYLFRVFHDRIILASDITGRLLDF